MEDSWRGLKSGFGRKIFPTRLHVRSARLARLHSLFLPVRLFLTKRRDASPYFRSAKITGNIPRRRIWILGSVFERNHRIYGPRSITNCEIVTSSLDKFFNSDREIASRELRYRTLRARAKDIYRTGSIDKDIQVSLGKFSFFNPRIEVSVFESRSIHREKKCKNC